MPALRRSKRSRAGIAADVTPEVAVQQPELEKRRCRNVQTAKAAVKLAASNAVCAMGRERGIRLQRQLVELSQRGLPGECETLLQCYGILSNAWKTTRG